MECHHITVPGTPFTLYYAMGGRAKTVNKFSIEHQRMDSKSLFSGCWVWRATTLCLPALLTSRLHHGLRQQKAGHKTGSVASV